MTDNQITIYLDPIAYKNIIRDQELFKTGTKISVLIKKIIINHYSEYKFNINELTQKIKGAIDNNGGNDQFNEDEYFNIAWKVTRYLSEKVILVDNQKREKKKKVNIRKNKRDCKLEFILDSCPKNASESEYLANIIYSYLKKSQCEREKIIYNDIISKIDKAIQNNQSIRMKTKSDKIQSINPKGIYTSNEGLYNYLLYQVYSEEKQKYDARTIHVYNILDIHLDTNNRIFQSDIEEQFEKMIRNGVQFSINENTIYKVKLTEDGEKLFKLRYLERPVPLPISDKESGIYYFNCSKMQFKSYFAPFRKNVIVLEPKEIVEEILLEYKEAIDNYEGIEKQR